MSPREQGHLKAASDLGLTKEAFWGALGRGAMAVGRGALGVGKKLTGPMGMIGLSTATGAMGNKADPGAGAMRGAVSGVGSAVGGVLGSAFGPLGSIAGSMAGGWAADKLTGAMAPPARNKFVYKPIGSY